MMTSHSAQLWSPRKALVEPNSPWYTGSAGPFCGSKTSENSTPTMVTEKTCGMKIRAR